MKRMLKVVMAATLFTLSACDSDDPLSLVVDEPAPTFDVQVLHASPDAPAVDVLVDGTAVLEDVDYKSGSGRLVLDAGTYSISVEGVLPDGNAAVIGPVDIDFTGDTIYTIAAIGSAAAIEPVVVTQPRTPVAAGSARIQVLHAAAAAPEVDVYVTVPGDSLAGIAPTGTFAFRGTIGPAEVAAGDYRIRVTPAGDSATILFDSGTVSLADGDDLFIAAVPNTADESTVFRAAAPISLAVLTGSGSIEILDAATPADLRVLHASPDAPPVNIVANDGFALPLVRDLAFTEFAGPLDITAGDYNVKVTAADNAGSIVIDADVSLAAGQSYDVLAVGPLATIEPLVLNDDPRPVSLFAKVRIVHASPTAQDVDIYLTAPGADIATLEPALASVPFKANTGYLEILEGSYDVTVTPAGSKTPAIGPATFSFVNGEVVTVVARDATGGGTPLDVIVVADAFPAP